MTFRSKYALSVLTAMMVTAGCASKPTTVENLEASANPTTEIQQTEDMINDARLRQVDVLSPKNFTAATKALENAKKQKEKSKSNEDILEQVAYSRGWLKEANTKAEVSQTALKNLPEARQGAIEAKANTVFPNEWARADKKLQNITADIEQGDLNAANEDGNDLTTEFRDLELNSVLKANLFRASDLIKASKGASAEQKAPKSWAMAQMKYANAEKIIRSNPKNTEAIRAASEAATREAVRLAEVITRVNAGNSEGLVLTSLAQQNTITDLRSENTLSDEQLQASADKLSASQKNLDATQREAQALGARQKELQQGQDVSQMADRVRKYFQPNEAVVYTENGKLMLRLKGLQFASNKSTLGAKSQELLRKVNTALADVEPTKITIEGHTDSTGSPDRNTVLSEERAQSVEKILVANGTIGKDNVQAVGVGPNNPISDNNTARGRSENRRIDLIIETN